MTPWNIFKKKVRISSLLFLNYSAPYFIAGGGNGSGTLFEIGGRDFR